MGGGDRYSLPGHGKGRLPAGRQISRLLFGRDPGEKELEQLAFALSATDQQNSPQK